MSLLEVVIVVGSVAILAYLAGYGAGSENERKTQWGKVTSAIERAAHSGKDGR